MIRVGDRMAKVQVDASGAAFEPSDVIDDLEALHEHLGNVVSNGHDDSEEVCTEDPAMAVYVKMLKMGVPKASVRQKMQMDGITDLSLLES